MARVRGAADLVDSLEGMPVGQRSGVITSKRSALLWQVLQTVYARLGFDAVDDAAFEQLVLARIVEPTSKADSLRVLEELGVEHASLRTMFRSLKRAGVGGYRDQVAAACFGHAATAGDVSLCLYDVTTLYFEVEKEDDLRKVGYSKERRVDPQVVVGLLVDRAGFPLEVGCFEGNKAETTTILPIISQFQARHAVADMVVVADAGMLSAGNLAELDAAGLRFIVGSRVTKAPNDLASHFRWHGDAFTDGRVIDTITPRTATKTSAAVNDPAKRAEPVWDPQVHDRSWRAVWAYSTKRAVRDGKTPVARFEGIAWESLGGMNREQFREAQAQLQSALDEAQLATTDLDWKWQHPQPAREPRQGRHRRREGRAHATVRDRHQRRPLPGRGVAGASPAAGRPEGVRHEHPRHAHARGRGDRQLPPAVARRGVVPDVQDRPARPTCLPPHP